MENIITGTLYLVATPIGNLSDISARAVQTLKDVDFIAAEDTRVTRKLLEHLNIKKLLVSYHKHNQRESGGKILDRIISGENCALVTDAGTPGISDPGEDLVHLCADANIQMISIPGPCAVVSALALSGLDAGRFTFEGFPPAIKKKRLERLNELAAEKRTMVFFEAPHKLTRTLADMFEVFGDRRISISRELTKIYEETLRFTLSEAIAHFGKNTPRGEFVLVVEGTREIPSQEVSIDDAVALATSYINSGASAKDAVKKASDETGIPKNTLYNAVISKK
jgi:16S rRNA (cytidine1402-2'-O)-methyltransferase